MTSGGVIAVSPPKGPPNSALRGESSHQIVNFGNLLIYVQTQHLQSGCPQGGLLSKNFGKLGPPKAHTTIDK